MGDRWLVLGKRLHEWRSLETAEAERDRLVKACPHQSFRVVRIKNTLTRSQSGLRCTQLEGAIRRALGMLNPANAAAKILLHELKRQPDAVEAERKVA
jgi:hypothetical protein